MRPTTATAAIVRRTHSRSDGKRSGDAAGPGEDKGTRVERPSWQALRMAESYPQRAFALPPDATEVVLVRHGASAAAVPGEPFEELEGQSDPPLAPEGEQQARAVAQRLDGSGEAFAGLFVTPLKRTSQTAAPLVERTGLEPVVVPELREVGLGEWEGGELRIRA